MMNPIILHQTYMAHWSISNNVSLPFFTFQTVNNFFSSHRKAPSLKYIGIEMPISLRERKEDTFLCNGKALGSDIESLRGIFLYSLKSNNPTYETVLAPFTYDSPLSSSSLFTSIPCASTEATAFSGNRHVSPCRYEHFSQMGHPPAPRII